uniref:Uncharacterized protein n=1 Tax=Nelumbo nucifera TaxID=4432 RepID=A0A822XQ24_NELNU|nr:TPA_asm: hypothetical protein HUJ06_025167 [Nelumbo nucifera]
MDERIDLSMSDPDLVPLIIQENYINYIPSFAGKDDNGINRMNLLARVAESIANGDIINVQIRSYQQWQLSQTSCFALHGRKETLEQGERILRLLENVHTHLLAFREYNSDWETL